MSAHAFGKGFAGAFGKGIQDSPFAPHNQFDDGISIEEAAEKSKLNFEIKEAPSLYMVDGTLHASGQKTLYRNDTGEYLSSMSQGFRVVQPMEILETHRQFLDAGGYHLRSAGVFKNGARFWSMAEAHGELNLKGDDRLKSYLFMASAVDGSSATYAIMTAIRAFCWNVAPAILKEAKNNGKLIRVPHSAVFDANEARVELASADDNFKKWCEDALQLSDIKIKSAEALEYFAQVFDIEEDDPMDRLDAALENRRVKLCLDLFSGQGMGSHAESSKDTVWGAYNAVTEMVDHHTRSESSESRFASSMMGNGYKIKTRAWELAQQFSA